MSDIMEYFKVVIILMLFYSFGISVLAYSLPEEALSTDYVTAFSEASNDIDLETVGSEVQGSLESQTNIPVIELGALVFYSGNILIDLLLNFAFAIPQMIGMLINGVMLLFNVDSYIFAIVELFAGVAMMVIYFIGLMQMFTNIVSGRVA